MSCITVVGRRRLWKGAGCNDRLPFSVVPWTESKASRLHCFAVSPDPTLRAIAAGHPRVAEEDIFNLVHDEHVMVRRALVKNPRIPNKVVHFMVQDPDEGIAAYARMVS